MPDIINVKVPPKQVVTATNSMFIYNIGYTSYEDSAFAQLYHKEQFTNAQLCEIVNEAVVAVIKQKKKGKHHYIHSYSGIHHEVVKYLISEKGFTYMGFDAWWTCEGWASMFIDDSGSEQDIWDSEELKSLRQTVKEAGYTKADDDFYEYEMM